MKGRNKISGADRLRVMELVSRCLKFHMRRLDMTQEELEAKAKVSQSTISCILNRKHSSQVFVIAQIADALGLTLSEFLDDPGPIRTQFPFP